MQFLSSELLVPCVSTQNWWGWNLMNPKKSELRWEAFFCGLMAFIQRSCHQDLTPYCSSLWTRTPGFVQVADQVTATDMGGGACTLSFVMQNETMATSPLQHCSSAQAPLLSLRESLSITLFRPTSYRGVTQVNWINPQRLSSHNLYSW